MSQQQTSPRTILLYGPSGVGKSTVIDFARPRMPQVSFGTLDDLVTEYGPTTGLIGQNEGAGELLFRLREDGFLELGRRAADRFRTCHPKSKTIVLDVGAGFLESDLVKNWIAQCTSVVLMADASTCNRRDIARGGLSRTVEVYESFEFTAKRIALYEMANHRIDTSTLDQQETGDRFVETLETITANES